jgi:hypothetical protein
VVGFIGIVVPHLLRLVIGPAHRLLLPASALLGAILVVGADTLARTIVAPAEMPIGILTAAIGAPFSWPFCFASVDWLDYDRNPQNQIGDDADKRRHVGRWYRSSGQPWRDGRHAGGPATAPR